MIRLCLVLALLAPASAAAQGAGFRAVFDSADQAINEGMGWTDSDNATGTLAWGQSYLMMGYAAMFRGTGDAGYLVKLAQHALAVLDQRDSVVGLTDYAGKSRPCWQSGKYSDGEQGYCWAVHTGMLTYPMADLALLLSEHPDVGWLPVPGGTTLAEDTATIVAEVLLSVAVHDSQLKSGPGANQMHYIGDPGATFTSVAGKALPLNQMNALGRTSLVLWQATGDPVHLDRAMGMLHYLRERMTVHKGALVWTYWGDPWKAGKGEDISHAAINVDFAALGHRAELVFSDQDIKQLGNTLFDNVHVSVDQVSNRVDGGAVNDPSYKMQVCRWLNLAWTDARAWAIGANFYRGVKSTGSGSVMAGLGRIVQHAPPVWDHTFYYVDWADKGDYNKATAYGANVLTDPPDKAQRVAVRLTYRTTKSAVVEQWDGDVYTPMARLDETGGDFDTVFIPYDPAIYHPYVDTAALYQLTDDFAASGGIEVKKPAAVEPPTILTEALQDAEVGVPFSQTLEGAGAAPLYWTLVDGPAGTALSQEGALTAALDEGAVFPVTVRLSNDHGKAEKTLNLEVIAPPDPVEPDLSEPPPDTDDLVVPPPDEPAPPDVITPVDVPPDTAATAAEPDTTRVVEPDEPKPDVQITAPRPGASGGCAQGHGPASQCMLWLLGLMLILGPFLARRRAESVHSGRGTV